MNPPPSSNARAVHGMQEVVRRPKDSDGVGSALRQIFSRPSALPGEFKALLDRLNDQSQ